MALTDTQIFSTVLASNGIYVTGNTIADYTSNLTAVYNGFVTNYGTTAEELSATLQAAVDNSGNVDMSLLSAISAGVQTYARTLQGNGNATTASDTSALKVGALLFNGIAFPGYHGEPPYWDVFEPIAAHHNHTVNDIMCYSREPAYASSSDNNLTHKVTLYFHRSGDTTDFNLPTQQSAASTGSVPSTYYQSTCRVTNADVMNIYFYANETTAAPSGRTAKVLDGVNYAYDTYLQSYLKDYDFVKGRVYYEHNFIVRSPSTRWVDIPGYLPTESLVNLDFPFTCRDLADPITRTTVYTSDVAVDPRVVNSTLSIPQDTVAPVHMTQEKLTAGYSMDDVIVDADHVSGSIITVDNLLPALQAYDANLMGVIDAKIDAALGAILNANY